MAGSSLRGILRTYNSTLYAARTTASMAKRLHQKFVAKKQAPKTDVVKRVRSKIAMREPLYANRKLYTKGSVVGQARRKALATKLKATPRPMRGKSSFATPAAKLTRTKPTDNKVRIFKGMTGRRLNQRIGRHNMREFVASVAKEHRGNRKDTADHIRDIRKQNIKPKFRPGRTSPLLKQASTLYAKTFGSK